MKLIDSEILIDELKSRKWLFGKNKISLDKILEIIEQQPEISVRSALIYDSETGISKLIDN